MCFYLLWRNTWNSYTQLFSPAESMSSLTLLAVTGAKSSIWRTAMLLPITRFSQSRPFQYCIL